MEVQQFLEEIGDHEKYLQLLGNMPMFDNCEFQQQTQSGDLFIQDKNLEKQNNLDDVS